MILKKTVVDGKVVYEPISKEEALALEDRENLLFTDEDEEEEFEELLEEKEEEEEEEEDDDEDDEEEEEDKEERADGKRGFGFFCGRGNRDKGQSRGGFFGMLPFLSDEDIHEYVEQRLRNEGPLEGLSLVGIMPFLKEADCDRLTLKYLDDSADKPRCSIAALAPFVSEKCMSEIVDGYLDGKYQNLSLESLYPFLPNRDVKRLFQYFTAKRKQNKS